MIWLLMGRLSLGPPTALQVRDGCTVLFHGGATFRLLSFDNNPSYVKLNFPPHSPSRTRALVDSNKVLWEPTSIFFIEAAPPHRQYTKWASKLYSRRFYIKT